MSRERNSSERECREANTGEWERVRYRVRNTERNGASGFRVPRRIHEGNRDGQKLSYNRANWRDKNDISSFYFTRIAEGVTELDIWNQFRKWGAVREIFISKQRNRNGWRFGFARFTGVEDAHRLAKQLDQIIIGGLRLYVNVPKYGRDETRKVGAQMQPERMDGKKQNENLHRKQYQVSTDMTSYAEVVARGKRNNSHSSKPINQRGEPQSSLQLDITATDKEWLRNTWVGRLKNLRWYDRLDEDPLWDFGEDITPKYIGGDMVLLLGLTDKMAECMAKEITEAEALFYSLEKWHPSLRPGNRLTWVHCWGIPLEAWDKKNIQRIVSVLGDMVDIDDDTEESRRMDRARVLIRTSRGPAIHHTINVDIRGDAHRVQVVEEVSRSGETCQCWRRRMEWSSEEIESDDSAFGSPINESFDPCRGEDRFRTWNLADMLETARNPAKDTAGTIAAYQLQAPEVPSPLLPKGPSIDVGPMDNSIVQRTQLRIPTVPVTDTCNEKRTQHVISQEAATELQQGELQQNQKKEGEQVGGDVQLEEDSFYHRKGNKGEGVDNIKGKEKARDNQLGIEGGDIGLGSSIYTPPH